MGMELIIVLLYGAPLALLWGWLLFGVILPRLADKGGAHTPPPPGGQKGGVGDPYRNQPPPPSACNTLDRGIGYPAAALARRLVLDRRFQAARATAMASLRLPASAWATLRILAMCTCRPWPRRRAPPRRGSCRCPEMRATRGFRYPASPSP
jgi:hypothetical protein